ncbi:MAG: hypothetical protein BroJett014_00100 [Planctomycetota bacterium]|nr:hypothetical protein [Planctomycetota bacterium]GIK51037.1 MAG: hypothetical protein BroJett014_00100 [Planctomycetota bacterium]
MRHVSRALIAAFSLLLLVNLSLAQKSDKEVGEENMAKLKGQGGREEHQGADNPRQGNTSKDQWQGGPDPYGSEDFEAFSEKNERNLNNPQWQLKLDLHDPKRIVIDYPDGRREEYWYILFRVINDNTRVQQTTTPDALNRIGSNEKPRPIGVAKEEVGREGVPVETHLDMEVFTYTRNIEKDPWDDSQDKLREKFIEAAKARGNSDEQAGSAADQAMRTVKKRYGAISDPYVLQQIAEKEMLYEWVEDASGNHRRINLLHPLSDFQRQIGRKHELSAPDLTGPRCLPHRTTDVRKGEITEIMRYVGINESDNTFAGWFGEEGTAPEGVRIVKDASDPMWGKVTQRRYQLGDCVDRFGRALRPNDPGYQNARIAGESEATGYGIIHKDHPLLDKPSVGPHYRLYQDGDKVLFDFDTGIKIPGRPNDTYRINGRIVEPADPRYEGAEAISASTEKFGGAVAGKPVKMIDSRGRAVRKFLVTYQIGEVISQAEWDIWKKRLGAGILSRYQNVDQIVGRPLTANDPLVGLPKIKMGTKVGEDELFAPEVIQRGVDTGRRGPNGEVILNLVEYQTGRSYNPLKVGPENFMRDPDGEYSTARVAPLPEGAALKPGEEYVYAPLGAAGEGSLPVPQFDYLGAWEDYRDPVSGSRIPLTDDQGAIVRDEFDQILYLKEYEYEYVYMYEFEPLPQDDAGFKGAYGMDRYELVKESIDMKFKNGKAEGPVREVIVEKRKVNVLSGDGSGKMVEEEEEVIVGIFVPGIELKPGQEKRKEDLTGYDVRKVDVVRYVDKARNEIVAGKNPKDIAGVGEDDYNAPSPADNELGRIDKTFRRWTIPPPLVYRNPSPGPDGQEWEVLTRLSDKIGPATRADGKDAPRFLTRYISEMWGVFIFKGVERDWNYLNIMVRGLRGRVSHAGLKLDDKSKDLPSYRDAGSSKIGKAFYNAKYVTEDWVYRARFERLGDSYENFRDLIRRVRTFWYLEKPREEIKTGE